MPKRPTRKPSPFADRSATALSLPDYGIVTTTTAYPPSETVSPSSLREAGGREAVLWSTTSCRPPPAPGTDTEVVRSRLFTRSRRRLPSLVRNPW